MCTVSTVTASLSSSIVTALHLVLAQPQAPSVFRLAITVVHALHVAFAILRSREVLVWL